MSLDTTSATYNKNVRIRRVHLLLPQILTTICWFPGTMYPKPLLLISLYRQVSFYTRITFLENVAQNEIAHIKQKIPI
jgi:hypothetical protein